jgi:hypothetical protein
LAESYIPKDQKALRKISGKDFFSTIIFSYKNNVSQNFDDFNKIIQNLDKFARPANQNEY